ncbi:MAG: PAS domain-containing protein, partial [Methanomicrobiales archaeon]
MEKGGWTGSRTGYADDTKTPRNGWSHCSFSLVSTNPENRKTYLSETNTPEGVYHMTPDTEKSAGSRPLNNSLTFPTPQKGWLPLILIIGLTIVIFIVSIISLLSGWQTIFQNLFYFPIILACVYYVRRGFVFSVVLACSYFVLMAIFSNDLVVLEGALIRVLIFILVAGVITYLSMIRIRAEDALKESKGRYRSLYTDSKDAIMIVSPEQGFLAANPATIRLFACRDEQDFTGHTPASLSPEYQPDGLSSTGKSREMMRLALENGSHFFEWTHRRVDGTDFPATVLLSRVESGGKQLLQATVRDITEHKQIVEVLRESEARFRTIINSMQFGIVIIDAHTHTILEANRKSLEMIGGSNESAIGSVCHRFICPAETGRCPVTDLGQTVDSSERVLLTMRGEKIPILKSVIKMMLGGKEVLVESFIDISERKEAEEALRETTE